MADCIHKTLVRIPVEGLELSSTGFRFQCAKCRVYFVAALDGTDGALDLAYIARVNVQPEPPKDFRPNHDAIIRRAEQAWAAAGLTFGEWRKMLRDGGISELAFRRQTSSLGFELGDVDQLVTAVLTTGEDSATR